MRTNLELNKVSRRNEMKKIISVLLCIALIATSFGAGASVSAAKKKKKAKAGTESMDLYYSNYANPKKLKDGHKLVKEFVINAKKKGKYTAKIKWSNLGNSWAEIENFRIITTDY